MKSLHARPLPPTDQDASAAELRQARQRLGRRVAFPPSLEKQYREAQSRRYRSPRMILFLTTTLAFLFGPFYGSYLFSPVPDIVPLLLALQLGLAVPSQLLGLISTIRHWPERHRHLAHSAAVASLWCCVVAHHLLAEMGYLVYPSEMPGIAVMAIAVFGGYRTRRFVIGSSLTLIVTLMITWHFEPRQAVSANETYATAFMWLIAVAGAVSLDLLSRHAWINQRYAKALAMTDGVTGLLSRRMFDELFLKTLSTARRDGVNVGVALIDLDYFKSVNDRFGHDKGDEVLAALAQVLRSTTAERPQDLCARYGGEEFVIIWYDVNAPTIRTRVDQLLTEIRALRYEAGDPPTPQQLTASIGATWFRPSGDDDRRAVIKAADELLYAAKGAGRDCARSAPFIRTA